MQTDVNTTQAGARTKRIEKDKYRRGEYIGFGFADSVYQIRKTNSSYGNWIGEPATHLRSSEGRPLSPIYAFTLAEMSAKLDAIARNIT